MTARRTARGSSGTAFREPFAVDGYKSIAYELVDAFGRVPERIVVPTSHADGLAGACRVGA